MTKIGLGVGLLRSNEAGGSIPTQSLTSLSINTNGWELDATITASKVGGAYANLNNYATPGLALTVRSVSWTSGGVQTTVDRTVIATAALRKAYNQHANRDEATSGSNITVKYVLSSKVYSSDSIVACSVAAGFFTDNGPGGSGGVSALQTPAVTNNSSQVYPAPIAMWLNSDRDEATSTSFSIGLTCAHRFFKSGQQVRAVKFIATDQHSNSASVIATAMSKITFTGSALNASEFRANLDLSTLTQGDLLTIDCIIYPWVGNSWQASVDGAAYPSSNMTTLRVLNNKTQAFGTAIAYVDGVGAGTPTVFGGTSAVTIATADTSAAANPYSTVALAAAAIKTFNNATYGRNDASGGIIKLTATTHTHGTFGAVTGGLIPLTIQASNPVNKATTIFRDSGANVFNGFPAYTKIKNLTLRKNGAGSVVFISTGGTTNSNNATIIDNCIFDLNATTDYDGWMLDVGQLTLINCTGNMLNIAKSVASNAKMINAWGCDVVAAHDAVYNHCGNKSQNLSYSAGRDAVAQFQTPGKCFMGWCFFGNADSGDLGAQRNNLEVALIGNVLEQRTGATQPLIAMNHSGTNTTTQMLDIANTGVGARENYLYNDGSSASLITADGISACSVWNEFNSKSDVFATNGVCIGNWSFRYRVDGFYCCHMRGDSNTDSVAADSWQAEIVGRGDSNGTNGAPIAVNWISDASFTVAGAGNGNYKPNSATTVLPQIPAGLTAFPFDLNGTAVPTNGTAYVGALQA